MYLFRNLKLYHQNKSLLFSNTILIYSERTCSLERKGEWYKQAKKKQDANKRKPEFSIKAVKHGYNIIKDEVAKWREEVKEKFLDDDPIVRPGDADIIYDYKNKDTIQQFVASSDSDWDTGSSHCSLLRSPTGHGLFTGYIDTKVPKDGKTQNSGYSNITSNQLRRSFMREVFYDWTPYTHLTMRVRGDGRNYHILLDTSAKYDVTWADQYGYLLYTRGGPYWQDIKIPFSKFIFTRKGRIINQQIPLEFSQLCRVRKLGVTLRDNITGNFRLEIDYIGVYNDPCHKEENAYERYVKPL